MRAQLIVPTANGRAQKERFLAVMDYKPVDRVPYWELGLWGQTIERWHSEGMPEDEPAGDFFEGGFWGLDRRAFADIKMHMIPWFEHEVIEENGGWAVRIAYD
ncbi:MAG: hypothetical protein ACE5O2_13590, partial [Armatimonadota bacterium]